MDHKQLRFLRLLAVTVIAVIFALIVAADINQSIEFIDRMTRSGRWERYVVANPNWMLFEGLTLLPIVLIGAVACMFAWKAHAIPAALPLAVAIAILTLIVLPDPRWFDRWVYAQLGPRGAQLYHIGIVAAGLAALLRFSELFPDRLPGHRVATSSMVFWVMLAIGVAAVFFMQSYLLLDISNRIRAATGASAQTSYAADRYVQIGPFFMNPIGMIRILFSLFHLSLAFALLLWALYNLLRRYAALPDSAGAAAWAIVCVSAVALLFYAMAVIGVTRRPRYPMWLLYQVGSLYLWALLAIGLAATVIRHPKRTSLPTRIAKVGVPVGTGLVTALSVSNGALGLALGALAALLVWRIIARAGQHAHLVAQQERDAEAFAV